MGISPPGLGRPSAPIQLTANHDISNFDCGTEGLNIWLTRYAFGSARSNSRSASVYVVVYDGKVIGYYTLSSSVVSHAYTTAKLRRNAPDPIPVFLIGRLAVDKDFQGQGIGIGLVKDALFRCLKAAEIIGVKAVIVHALGEETASFYERFGFKRSPVVSSSPTEPKLLMISIDQIRHALSS